GRLGGSAFDRPAFAARFGADVPSAVIAEGYDGVLTAVELAEVYAPLARLVGGRAADQGSPFVVSVVGSVAVGKSASAAALAHCLAAVPAGRVSVGATDGVLFPDRDLAPPGRFTH